MISYFKKHLSELICLIVVLYLLVSFVSDMYTNESYHWDIVFKYLFYQRIIEGLGWTLILTVLSMLIGVFLAIVLALWQRGDNRVLQTVSKGYIWFFRGTPIYTQLVFWGLAAVLWPKICLGIPFSSVHFFEIDTAIVFNAAVAAIVGLSLNEAAYLSEIVRAGIDCVPKGQSEAGYAIGLTKMQVMYRIVLPQAMKLIVPPTGNETISMLKTTSLVLAVPFTIDINYIQGTIASRLFLPIPLLLVACFWYLLVTSILMFIQSKIENHFGKGVISAG